MDVIETPSSQTILKPTKLSYQLLEPASNAILDQLTPGDWLFQNKGALSDPAKHLICLNDAQGQPLAVVVVVPANQSYFQSTTGIEQSILSNCLYLGPIWMSKRAIISDVLPTILYFALRRGRIWGKEHVVLMLPIPNKMIPIATLLRLERIKKISIQSNDGACYGVYAQSIKYSIYKIYEQCHDQAIELIKQHFVDEVLEIHEKWLARFYSGSWAKAIVTGSLTKEQYISSLYNLHEYVRHTTRIAARCVAFAKDRTIRNHFIYHMRGEINHELMIERDLKTLGADVDYLLDAHVPMQATKQFMMTQESVIGFYQDPFLLLACPLAAEGVAAHMMPDFIDALFKVIASWGIEDPKQAAWFLTSHVNTDGGGDGHWQSVVKTLQYCLVDEKKQQRFLSTLFSAMYGFELGFNANVDELRIWQAKLRVASHNA